MAPPGESKAQSPFWALGIEGTETHPELKHVPWVDHSPLLQEAERVPSKPSLHFGVHVDPLAAPEMQSPGVAIPRLGKSPQKSPTQAPLTDQVPEAHVARTSPE